MMIRLCVLLSVLVLSLNASARTRLVISDIDDTLKISHVLDPWDAVQNVPKIESVFGGMDKLFRALAETPNIQFEYVSNAPEHLMSIPHQAFLGWNAFPEGGFWLKPLLSGPDFKLRTIRQLLQTHQPEEVLFLGDNGEEDGLVYDSLEREFPRIRFTTLIHQIYSAYNPSEQGRPLRGNQLGFVTSMDASITLFTQGWLSWAQADELLSQVELMQLMSKDDDVFPVFIPLWADCRDFREPLVIRDERVTNLLDQLRKRCHFIGNAEQSPLQ